MRWIDRREAFLEGEAQPLQHDKGEQNHLDVAHHGLIDPALTCTQPSELSGIAESRFHSPSRPLA